MDCQIVRTEKQLLEKEGRENENTRREDRTHKQNDYQIANRQKPRSRVARKRKDGARFTVTQQGAAVRSQGERKKKWDEKI
jgi:hypothetical protein